MPLKRIITGQQVPAIKVERAKEFRHEMAAAEQMLWSRLRAGRLEGFHFRRQQVIDRFIVDFYCHQAALVVEVDGGIHLEQAAYDRERDEHLQNRGLRVLHFTNLEVSHDLEGVLTLFFRHARQKRARQTYKFG
jgi:very-short-patch-repair endonuclease